MHQTDLKSLLAKIRTSRIGIVGDFCLDVYLLLEPAASESSLETGLSTRPVRTQRYSLGAAGNVAGNLHALGVGTLWAFGVLGEDPFGREMSQLLTFKGVNTTGLLVQREQWDSHVYMKPHERQQEQHRFDFGNFNELHASTSTLLLETLTAVLPFLDLVIINQQVRNGIHTKEFRDPLRSLVLCHPEKCFIADSRHFADEYAGCIRKINTLEAARLTGRDSAAMDAGELQELAESLFRRWSKPVFLTREETDASCAIQRGEEAPGLLILSPVDPVEAGDSMPRESPLHLR